MKNHLSKTLLILSLIIGVVVRLKDINAPLADWHSFRQADTASVAREYVKHGIDLLRPTYHDMSNIQSGVENPKGYRMVEFPIISGIVAFIYQNIPYVHRYELHVVYRFINILFSLLSAFLLYKIFSGAESRFTGVLTAAIFLLLPFNIYYSRTVLPEVAMVTMYLLAVWFGFCYFKHGKTWEPIVAGFAAAMALLLKPTAIFFLLPLIPLFFKQKKAWLILLTFLISIGPLVWWRWWIGHFPSGIPASEWLLNGNGIRFKGAFFYWIFADRLGRLLLGYWGLILLGVGFLARKKSSLLLWWVIGSLFYVIVFAAGNVQHDYYQIPIVPVLCGLIAYGIQYLRRMSTAGVSRYGLLVVSLVSMMGFSWYYVRDYFHINNWAMVRAGEAVKRLTPADALVIAPYMGDTAFLYQTDRKGWPIGFNIPLRISQGATYYVSTSYDDEARELESKYQVVEKTSDYLVIRLATN